MNNQILQMIAAAQHAMNNAYVPTFGFAVGACLRTEEGKVFAGCNIENDSFPLSQCAEASAIGVMVSAGYKQIAEVVIVANKQKICPPCGACRQRLWEFSSLNTKVYLCHEGKVMQTLTMADLLPFPFILQEKISLEKK